VAKTRQEIENRMLTPVFTFKPKKPAPSNLKQCKCGCGNLIDAGMDSYIIIDEDLFYDDPCVVTHFIKEAGGRRVYGGAC
jgi:hypothetical protein